MAGSAGVAGAAERSFFVRKASGLVRQASTFDAFILNVYFINIGMGVAFMILFYAFYPGANLLLTTLATLVLCLPTSLLYVMFMSAMPRSGGDYVYVTRSLGSALGFVSNWNWNMWNLYLMGIAGSFFALYGISGLFRTIAGLTGNAGIAGVADFVTTPTGQFLVGGLLITGLILLFAYGQGLRAYLKFQKISFFIASVALAVAVIALLVVSRDGFVSSFNSYVQPFAGDSNAYQTVLEEGGFTESAFSFKQSMLAVTWPFLVLGFGIASSYIGGEIKMGHQVFLRSVTGSLVYSAGWMALIVAFLFAVVGGDFLGSLGVIDPTVIGLEFTPTFAELGAAASQFLLFGLVIAIGFALWTYVWAPGYILSWSRSMVAWSLDRVVPAKLGEVDRRHQAPVFGLFVLWAGSMVSVALYSYTDLLAVLAGAFGEALTFVMVSIAGIVFPFRQREIWRSSPYNQRILGVPLMSIMGVLSLIGMLTICFILLNDVNSGVHFREGTRNVIVTIVTFLSGFVVYFIAKFVQARRGVDVTLAYKEIPPE